MKDLLAVHRLNPQRYPFLLQSAAQGTPDSRFDLLFMASKQHLALPDTASGSQADTFLRMLDRWTTQGLNGDRAATQDPLDAQSPLPFTGGWFIYLGYEVARGIEPILANLPDAPAGFPQALAVRCPAAFVFDHELGQMTAVSESPSLLQQMIVDYEQAQSLPSAPVAVTELSEDPPEQFLNSVDRVRQYVVAGDIFQANISRRWYGPHGGGAADLYAQLKSSNPAPFAGLANWQGHAVVSSSPERLIAQQGRLLKTRPIAGTFPRSQNAVRDREQCKALLAHPKERAEHVMLIDLERNDLGRVCEPGSIDVSQFMTTESYPNVHHIVSEVCGTRRKNISPVEVIRAVFPGGTITGCPKVRCMQIIGELEGVGRGPYTGAMGYLNLNGDMDLNILIRTMHLTRGQVSLRAGAGIVADSDRQRELEETHHKAAGMLAAFETLPRDSRVSD